MRRYKIADYLTPEQKARAVEARYRLGRSWYAVPDGQCPLGIALGLPWSPTATAVRVALAPAGPAAAIARAAAAFIRAWDRGTVTPSDLPVALGVDA